MQQQQQSQNGLTVGKAALIGTLVAVPVGIGAFLYGYSNNLNPAPETFAQTTQSTQTNAIDLRIKGNKNSKIYHMKGCPNYNDISERNIVWFKTKEEAEAAGYRMAKNC